MLRLDDDAGRVIAPGPRPGRRDLLYVHVPFCESLCPFCTFHRVRLETGLATEYFKVLRDELRRYRDAGFEFSAVYVGGGTPTVLPDELARTLELIRALFGVREISVETNPNHLRDDVLERLVGAGVKRLSVGVQSFDDDRLREMGRYAAYGSGAQIRERLANAAGVFDTLNVDMIFNFPHQTLDSVAQDIAILVDDLGVDQISFYPLMPAESGRRNSAQTLGDLTFTREPQFYDLILEQMTPRYSPSSVWCFSKSDGMIDEYIVEQDNYIGAGSGAFSYFDGVFYSSSFSIPLYMRRIESGSTGIICGKRYSELDQLRYDFLVRLFGLRLDGRFMTRKYGEGWRRSLRKELLAFELLGALRRSGDDYRLTTRGMYLWLVMMREFLTGVNRFRADMRAHIAAESARYVSPAVSGDGSRAPGSRG